MGAMMIYMDIINLFIEILRILGKKKDDWLNQWTNDKLFYFMF
jgi:hypothetical protein